MATFKPVIFATNNHIKSDGTTNIKIRIYHNKQSQYIASPYYVQPEHMGEDGNILSSYKNCELLNYELGEIIQRYRGIDIKLGKERVSRMSCMDLKEHIIAAVEPDYEFIDFIAFSRNVIAETAKDRTREWYETSLSAFIWWIKKEKIDARDITSKKIEDYIKQLTVSGQNSNPMEPGGISNYVRGLRALYNKCKDHYNDEDHNIIRIHNNPFPKGVVPAYRRKKKSVSVSDIQKIKSYVPRTKREEIAKDVFLASIYLIGINVSDLYKLTNKEYKRGRITYERSKTNTDDNIYNYPLSIRVEPELQDILDKYSDGRLFSALHLRYNNSKNFMRATNEGLDDICTELKLPYKITTNWARHTWATIARNKAGVPKADVDFCLGHVNNDTKMADIYIDIDYGIFDEANRKVLDLLK